MSVQLLAVVSDTHCGSDVGLAHPESKLHSGNVVGFGDNVIQQWFWACFNEAIERVFNIAGPDEMALLINGDATEGDHHRTKELIATDEHDHIAIALQCLMPLAERCKEVFVVKGTECHTRNMETELAKKLGAAEGIAKDQWRIRIHDTLIDAKHHMPTTSRRYLEAGALSITLGNARLNCADAGHELPKVLLRGHRHCGGWYSSGHAAIGVTGAWQALTRHAKKVVPDSLPSPSILLLDWRNLPKNSVPICHEIKFNPPEPQAFVL